MKTIKYKLSVLGLSLASILFASCTSLANAKNNNEPNALETVAVTEVALELEPTPVQCTTQTNDVNIQVEITSSGKVQVMVNGLQPGENVVLVYERNLPESDWRREQGQTVYTPNNPIGEDGTFEDSRSVSRFEPEEGVTPNEWMVKVIHTGGVTCTSFIAPSK
jgi:hypothetical protein